MNYKFYKVNKITKDVFLNLKEDALLFITSPGRMGDEDGSTFVIKKNNKYIAYRIDGCFMGNDTDPNYISYFEMLEHFPKWNETLRQETQQNEYEHIYMGFGNGLCVKKYLYNSFFPYLEKEIDIFLKENGLSEEEKESQKYGIIFNVWDKALVKMAKDNNVDFE